MYKVPPSSRWNLNAIKERHKDYTARIFQHEIDHLNGKIFIDHIKDPANLHLVEEKEFPLYRDQEAWRNWPKKYRLTKWRDYKPKTEEIVATPKP